MFKNEIKNELRAIYECNEEIDEKMVEIKIALHNLEKLGIDTTELYKQLENVGIEFYKFKMKNANFTNETLKKGRI